MLQNRIREFTLAANGGVLPKSIEVIEQADKEFILKMIRDEMEELDEAETDVQIIDALVDATYYMFDFCARKGINLDRFIEIVHAANMQKIVGGVVLRETEDPARLGKILKPPGWETPDARMQEEYKLQREGSVALRRIYVASPYSSPIMEIVQQRYKLAQAAVAFLSGNLSDAVYSPIVHFHHVATDFDMPTHAEHWRIVNFIEIERSDAVFVVQGPGWKESIGVTGEIAHAKSVGCPLYSLLPVDWGTAEATFELGLFD